MLNDWAPHAQSHRLLYMPTENKRNFPNKRMVVVGAVVEWNCIYYLRSEKRQNMFCSLNAPRHFHTVCKRITISHDASFCAWNSYDFFSKECSCGKRSVHSMSTHTLIQTACDNAWTAIVSSLRTLPFVTNQFPSQATQSEVSSGVTHSGAKIAQSQSNALSAKGAQLKLSTGCMKKWVS